MRERFVIAVETKEGIIWRKGWKIHKYSVFDKEICNFVFAAYQQQEIRSLFSICINSIHV